MARTLTLKRVVWPIRGAFVISRGAKSTADVLVAEIEEDGKVGRGECVPYRRYGETLETVEQQILSVASAVEGGIDCKELQRLLPSGAARNAVDCALWDLEAKRTGTPVWRLAGLPRPGPLITAYTISLGDVATMATQAREQASRPILKLKLTGDGDLERVRAVRENAPASRLIVDANEAWTLDHLSRFGPDFEALGVELIEQPLPAGADDALAGFESAVPLCADESCHDTASLERCLGKYAYVNIKLDKAGGLTEALRLRQAALAAGFKLMVGCMVGSSLAMAPAVLVAQGADVVDLDGPLLLTRDHHPALSYEGATIHPPEPRLWG